MVNSLGDCPVADIAVGMIAVWAPCVYAPLPLHEAL
jgi:hypothetical protein